MSIDKKLCVFCGSSFGKDPIYAEIAFKFGKLLAEKNWGLVYGGGSTGVMGSIAKGCATSGGYVHGIIPEALISKERNTEDVNEAIKKDHENHKGFSPLPDSSVYGKTTMVKDMHTRKRMMGEESDAFVAMPGGYGTFEELLEVTTWYQLGIHKKPIVLLNINGFWDTFLKFIDESIEAGFIAKKQRELLNVATTPEEVIQLVEKFTHEEGHSYGLNWSES
ncbi:hypothetical protein PSN45_001114 [Yamadazyma tenuis]|uniref:Uncharacterized protein n=1 Tax=Candida tenuis (strain ATCC 10573 / BCRC 21748 / CBS 615 / JCM 9827 / NBRC 10315 / NRRL Y-1498 / VKM Y-70) TaxID=590646 RepID=G3B8E5_CANTC|nr:uncharacterized protein CANTEDRAFT_115838 [Yamadazyma tenuis ATCC 10573]EGV62382.1 hypothetical protein CANTEDRAFT_115838 [Yamadazyma tenuis ATCC 10573]WEJ93645.1 hypothetical protein PSN45_001114 [Yamadazyma tenuis]